MRIYVPCTPAHVSALEAMTGKGRLALPAGCDAWAVSDAARADRGGEDIEDLEYDALQDAVYAALESSPEPVLGDGRVAVVAGDVPDDVAGDASDRLGAFGIEITRECGMRVASVHVTEQGADAVRADDTDPALLWFDVAELTAALAYLARPAATR